MPRSPIPMRRDAASALRSPAQTSEFLPPARESPSRPLPGDVPACARCTGVDSNYDPTAACALASGDVPERPSSSLRRGVADLGTRRHVAARSDAGCAPANVRSAPGPASYARRREGLEALAVVSLTPGRSPTGPPRRRHQRRESGVRPALAIRSTATGSSGSDVAVRSPQVATGSNAGCPGL